MFFYLKYMREEINGRDYMTLSEMIKLIINEMYMASLPDEESIRRLDIIVLDAVRRRAMACDE